MGFGSTVEGWVQGERRASCQRAWCERLSLACWPSRNDVAPAAAAAAACCGPAAFAALSAAFASHASQRYNRSRDAFVRIPKDVLSPSSGALSASSERTPLKPRSAPMHAATLSTVGLIS